MNAVEKVEKEDKQLDSVKKDRVGQLDSDMLVATRIIRKPSLKNLGGL
jgi:hypothetical protein